VFVRHAHALRWLSRGRGWPDDGYGAVGVLIRDRKAADRGAGAKRWTQKERSEDSVVFADSSRYKSGNNVSLITRAVVSAGALPGAAVPR
jgi:hypothetical protein